MNLLSKTAPSSAKKSIVAAGYFILLFLVCLSNIQAQNSEVFTLTADALQDGKNVELAKAGWKYQAGDDVHWANPQFDDSGWEKPEETSVKPDLLSKSDWNGRAWFRLHFKVGENLADKTFALVAAQRGAAEIYLDGKKLADFGSITDSTITEYNPAGLPVFFQFENAGEHLLAVRFASEVFADTASFPARWMTNGGVYPGFTYYFKEVDDAPNFIERYSDSHSMRVGYLFIGVLLALALLHFLLYIFYRVERGNLFYSIYAAAFASVLVIGNFITFGHQSIFTSLILTQFRNVSFAVVFTALLTFLHVAFNRRLGKLFWILTGLWIVNVLLGIIWLNGLQFLGIMLLVLIALTFSFSIFILVQSLRKKHNGAWILMGGILIFSLGMLSILSREIFNVDFYGIIAAAGEIVLILAVPISVSIFLARNFANTSRNLKTQLEQVEFLSAQQIEQERQSAELRAENERRAKELEEARQLQLSMLPRKLPKIPNLEIAAYMKPATEVGGDYYDFHVGADGTLTVAVGDATGHGLKAGSVVTATKSLFNAFAENENIPQIFKQSSAALKKMNLRGLFMAMTMLKLKDNRFSISAAGMPSTLIYRAATGEIEEINLRAVPLGSIAAFKYQEQEFTLSNDDCVIIMSDGFPEMFNEAGEMLGEGEVNKTLTESADLSPQEIINHFVKVGEDWAGQRPQDDDVTFVVLKVKS